MNWRGSWYRCGEPMRVAALDYGTVRIGLAVSDELGVLAHPRPAVDARNRRAALEAILHFAEEENIERFVVGVPLDRDGNEGIAARKALDFANEVANVTKRPVDHWDERLSTVEATRRLQEGGHKARQGRSRVDGAAACIILQAWMDRQRGHAE